MPTATPLIVSSEFRDFDAFRESLHAWDTRPVQLGAGQLWIRWDELRVADFGVARLAFNQRLADSSAVEPGQLGFCIALRPHDWCGLEVPAGSLIINAPGRELRAVHLGDFESLEIIASEAVLHDAGLIDDHIDPRDLPPERSVVRLAPGLLRRFERIARRLSDRSPGPQAAWEGLESAHALRNDALGLVAIALAQHTGPWARRVPRYALAHTAVRIIEENAGLGLGAGEVARALGVTPRALEYAFHSVYGCGPGRYARALALNAVRRDLLANPHESVTAIAFKHGFNHLGRFSNHYRRLFAELPSKTRRSR